MKDKGIGGANTRTGLEFEIKTDLKNFIAKQEGYSVENCDYNTSRRKVKGEYVIKKGKRLLPDEKAQRWEILYENQEVAKILRKNGLYRYFDEIKDYDYTKYISSKLLPDDAIFVIERNTVFIIEKKTQKSSGSVDEKLQTCDFKLKQYKKLFAPLNKEVKYYYLLEKTWFSKPKYKDVLDYIINVGCGYYFNYIPLSELGLPVPKENTNES